jgi:hypothetical protein
MKRLVSLLAVASLCLAMSVGGYAGDGHITTVNGHITTVNGHITTLNGHITTLNGAILSDAPLALLPLLSGRG